MCGSLSWARTSDKRINSPLLYQLSYQGLGLNQKTLVLSQGFEYGSLSWARTSDKRINSPLLYQLSYQGIVIFLNPNPQIEMRDGM